MRYNLRVCQLSTFTQRYKLSKTKLLTSFHCSSLKPCLLHCLNVNSDCPAIPLFSNHVRDGHWTIKGKLHSSILPLLRQAVCNNIPMMADGIFQATEYSSTWLLSDPPLNSSLIRSHFHLFYSRSQKQYLNPHEVFKTEQPSTSLVLDIINRKLQGACINLTIYPHVLRCLYHVFHTWQNNIKSRTSKVKRRLASVSRPCEKGMRDRLWWCG